MGANNKFVPRRRPETVIVAVSHATNVPGGNHKTCGMPFDTVGGQILSSRDDSDGFTPLNCTLAAERVANSQIAAFCSNPFLGSSDTRAVNTRGGNGSGFGDWGTHDVQTPDLLTSFANTGAEFTGIFRRLF